MFEIKRDLVVLFATFPKVFCGLKLEVHEQLTNSLTNGVSLSKLSRPRLRPSQRPWRPKRLCSRAYTARGRRKSGLLPPSVALKPSVSAGSPSILARVLLAGTSESQRLINAEIKPGAYDGKSDQSMKKHDSSFINYWCTQPKPFDIFVVENNRQRHMTRNVWGLWEIFGLMYVFFSVGWITMPSSSSPWQQSPPWRRLRTTTHLCSLWTSRQTSIRSSTLSRSCTTSTSPKSTRSSGRSLDPVSCCPGNWTADTILCTPFYYTVHN